MATSINMSDYERAGASPARAESTNKPNLVARIMAQFKKAVGVVMAPFGEKPDPQQLRHEEAMRQVMEPLKTDPVAAKWLDPNLRDLDNEAPRKAA